MNPSRDPDHIEISPYFFTQPRMDELAQHKQVQAIACRRVSIDLKTWLLAGFAALVLLVGVVCMFFLPEN